MLRDIVVGHQQSMPLAMLTLKKGAWVSICMHACGSVSYSYGAPLGSPLSHQRFDIKC